MPRSLHAFCLTLLCVFCLGCNSNRESDANDAVVVAEGGRPAAKESSAKDKGSEVAKAPGKERRRFDFSQLDTDGDGKMSRDEAPDRLSESFDEIDADTDGFVTESEIREFFSRFSGGTSRPGGGDRGGDDSSGGGVEQTTLPGDAPVVEMLKRVGGSMERLAGFDHGPKPIVSVAFADTTATAEDVALLKDLPNLYELELASKGLGDNCLICLQEFPFLVTLRLKGDQFTDQGMEHVSSLQDLKRLELGKTVIGRDGLVTLSKVPSLELLHFVNQEIGAERLEALREFRSVYEIRFTGCEVSEEELSKLQKALPDCDVLAD